MANEMWKRYLDAGMTFSETDAQARRGVRAGPREGGRGAAGAGAEGGRRPARPQPEEHRGAGRARAQRRSRSQVSTLGIATKDDIKRLDGKINQLSQGARGQEGGRPPEKAAAKKSAGQEDVGREEGASHASPARRRARPPGARAEPGAGPATRSQPGGSPWAALPRTSRRGSCTPRTRCIVAGDAPRFVSRGGDKLDAALERFAHRRRRQARPRRRRLHRRLHRLPAPAGRGARASRSTSATASSTSGCGRTSGCRCSSAPTSAISSLDDSAAGRSRS